MTQQEINHFSIRLRAAVDCRLQKHRASRLMLKASDDYDHYKEVYQSFIESLDDITLEDLHKSELSENRLLKLLQNAVKNELDKYDADVRYASQHNNTDGVGQTFDYYSPAPLPKWVVEAQAAIKKYTLKQ